MLITVDLSEEEIDLLESCVSRTEDDGYDVTEDEKVIAKLREAVHQSGQSDASEEWTCEKCGTKNHDVRKNCRVCGLLR